jgi:hypothetical protein
MLTHRLRLQGIRKLGGIVFAMTGMQQDCQSLSRALETTLWCKSRTTESIA